MGFRDEGFGFRDQGLGFGACSGCRVRGLWGLTWGGGLRWA